MPFNERMDKESVKYIHIRVLLSGKKNNDILNFACKWMEIENTTLSEITQTPKSEYQMYSLIKNSSHKKDIEPIVRDPREPK